MPTEYGRRLELDDVGSSSVSSTGGTVIQSRKYRYELGSLITTGDVSDIYKVTRLDDGKEFAMKIAMEPQDNDLLETEANALGHIRSGSKSDSHMLRYFPDLVDTFKVDGKQANVLTLLTNYHSLVRIREVYPDGVRFEHGVWMLNRILEGIDFIHRTRRAVHGGVTPSHVMIYAAPVHRSDDRNNHGAVLVSLGASTPVGGRVRVISPDWRACYPPEVLNRHAVDGSTDVFMAVKSIIYVLGGDPASNTLPSSVPEYLARFLVRCATPASRRDDAWALHEELKELMERNFGPKQYFQFDMPA
jgi:hypothetical protein